MKLPVFKVASTTAPAERTQDLGTRIFPREDQQIVERGTLAVSMRLSTFILINSDINIRKE